MKKENLFTQVSEKVSEITGIEIPKNLATLRGRPERHSGVIDKEEMLNFVLGL